MKKLFAALVICTALLTMFTFLKKDEAIIIYSSMEQFRGEEMQKQLNEAFPDLEIRVMYVSTAKAAAKLRLEGKDTDADIVVGLENAYMEQIKDNMTDVSSYSQLEYLEDMQVDTHKYLTWERQAGSVIVNREILDKAGLPVPKTYADLLRPEYRDLIAMPDPKSSGTGYFFYKNLVNVMGTEEALAYFDKLAVNVKQFTESGSGPVKLLIQGEVAVGLGLTFQGMNEKNNGNHFEIIEPEYGSPYSLTDISMLEGRQKNADIVRVFEFLANEFIIYDKEYFSPEQILKEQTNHIEGYPKNIRYADMNGIGDIKEKERLLSVWKY